METTVSNLLPHRPPILLIDELVECGETTASGCKTYYAGSFGTDGDVVLESALIESLAQTVAAMQGYHAHHRPTSENHGSPASGMLVGVNDFVFHRTVRVGETIEMSIEVTRQLGQMIMATGRVFQSGQLMAQGGLTFFVPPPEERMER